MDNHPSDHSRVPVASRTRLPAAVLCAAAATLLGSGGAQATPAKDFSSDVTMTFVERLRVISEEEVDSRGRKPLRPVHRHQHGAAGRLQRLAHAPGPERGAGQVRYRERV